MAAVLERAKLNINRTGSAPPISRNFVESKALSEKNKGVHKTKSNKYRLDHSILEPDTHITYLEFLERNPLRLSLQRLKGRTNHQPQKKMDLGRIEETYWSQWKPNKNSVLIQSTKMEDKKVTSKTQKNTRGEGDRNYNIKNDPTEIRNRILSLEYKQSKPLSKIDELTEDDKDLDTSSSTSNMEEPSNSKFLKHTDSFILNNKRQSEEKPHYQQPRCIRLYKKTSSISYMKGGSYPLKPCLKKESTFKGYTRRPLSGSPYCANIFKSVKNKMKAGSNK